MINNSLSDCWMIPYIFIDDKGSHYNHKYKFLIFLIIQKLNKK